MSKYKTHLLAIFILICFSGCMAYQENSRDLGHSFGTIQIRDLQEAKAYREQLPKHLGLKPEQVKVEAGSGITYVKIKGVTTEPDRERIAKALEKLNQENPQLNPLKWTFQH